MQSGFLICGTNGISLNPCSEPLGLLAKDSYGHHGYLYDATPTNKWVNTKFTKLGSFIKFKNL